MENEHVRMIQILTLQKYVKNKSLSGLTYSCPSESTTGKISRDIYQKYTRQIKVNIYTYIFISMHPYIFIHLG